jgi:hypothetical protein
MERTTKRRGVNLARTVDGAPYNKLQRPDDFTSAQPAGTAAPVEVLRETVWEGSRMKDRENDIIGIDLVEEEAIPPPSRRREEMVFAEETPRIDVTTGMHGALALPEFDSSDLSDDEESYDVMQYIRAVRSVSFSTLHFSQSPKAEQTIVVLVRLDVESR